MSGDKVTVKTESAAFKRLPSFKQPRDLKLSQFSNPLAEARTKKVFVPNLNVQRKKQNESQEGSTESSNEKRDRNKREERQRQKKNFVQGQGIFSEGLAPQMKRFSSGGRYSQESSGGGGGSGGGSGSIPKPKLKLNEPIKVDQNEEDLIMKELMRDDFIDDPGFLPDLDDSPVNLPLKKMEDLKMEDSKEDIPKLKADETVQVNGVRIKQEPTLPQPQVYKDEKPIDISGLRSYTPAEILHNRAQDNNFVFFQIPNSIPRLKVAEVAKTNKKSQQKEEEDEGIERCSLRSLPPGQIGTLQILRSGRARLLLGDVKLKFESGTQLSFQKELVSVDLNSSEKTGNIIHVGNLTTRILVTPDWETLIKTNKST